MTCLRIVVVVVLMSLFVEGVMDGHRIRRVKRVYDELAQLEQNDVTGEKESPTIDWNSVMSPRHRFASVFFIGAFLLTAIRLVLRNSINVAS